MRYFKDTKGNIFAYDEATQEELIDIAIADGLTEITDGSWPPAVAPVNPLVQQAAGMLTVCDRVAIRCAKNGVPYTSAWQTYDAALVNIVNGTDTTSTALPTKPSTYPPGS